MNVNKTDTFYCVKNQDGTYYYETDEVDPVVYGQEKPLDADKWDNPEIPEYLVELDSTRKIVKITVTYCEEVVK